MEYQSLTRQTPPIVEPVTLSEAKAHLRVDATEDDAYIATLISAAREWCEQYLDRTLVLTQWTMRMEEFPEEEIELPRPPVASSGTATAVTITYTLTTGETAQMASETFRVDRYSTPGEIHPPYATTWPVYREDENAITVTWWGGYGSSGRDVPAAIRHAILMLVGLWFERRMAADSMGGTEIPFGVKSLLDSQRWGAYR